MKRFFFALLLFFVPFLLVAQSAQFSGLVFDPSNAAVIHASVQLTNEQTLETSSARTNDAGLFFVPSLKPGSYTIRVSAPGFETEVLHSVQVEVAGKVSRNITLHVGSESQQVMVNSSGEELNTTDASVSTVVDAHVR